MLKLLISLIIVAMSFYRGIAQTDIPHHFSDIEDFILNYPIEEVDNTDKKTWHESLSYFDKATKTLLSTIYEIRGNLQHFRKPDGVDRLKALGYLEKGSDLYKKRDYEVALTCFIEVNKTFDRKSETRRFKLRDITEISAIDTNPMANIDGWIYTVSNYMASMCCFNIADGDYNKAEETNDRTLRFQALANKIRAIGFWINPCGSLEDILTSSRLLNSQELASSSSSLSAIMDPVVKLMSSPDLSSPFFSWVFDSGFAAPSVEFFDDMGWPLMCHINATALKRDANPHKLHFFLSYFHNAIKRVRLTKDFSSNSYYRQMLADMAESAGFIGNRAMWECALEELSYCCGDFSKDIQFLVFRGDYIDHLHSKNFSIFEIDESEIDECRYFGFSEAKYYMNSLRNAKNDPKKDNWQKFLTDLTYRFIPDFQVRYSNFEKNGHLLTEDQCATIRQQFQKEATNIISLLLWGRIASHSSKKRFIFKAPKELDSNPLLTDRSKYLGLSPVDSNPFYLYSKQDSLYVMDVLDFAEQFCEVYKPFEQEYYMDLADTYKDWHDYDRATRLLLDHYKTTRSFWQKGMIINKLSFLSFHSQYLSEIKDACLDYLQTCDWAVYEGSNQFSIGSYNKARARSKSTFDCLRDMFLLRGTTDSIGFLYDTNLAQYSFETEWRNKLRESLAGSTKDREIADFYNSLKNKSDLEGMKVYDESSLFYLEYLLSKESIHVSNDDRYSWRDIQKMLQEGECAIEYSYCFMPIVSILKPGYPYPHVYLLPRLDTGYDYVDIWEDPCELMRTDIVQAYYDNFWKHLEGELADVKNIYISFNYGNQPHPFEYVKDANGDYICDKYNVYRMTTTKELMHRYDKLSADKRGVLVGGIDFDEILWDSDKNDHILADGTRGNRGANDYLPYSKAEIDNIETILGASGYSCHVLADEEVTERRFKELSGQHIDILHIATHGFNFDDMFKSGEFDTKRHKGTALFHMIDESVVEPDGQLWRYGLALAGSNKVLTGEDKSGDLDDGILTAYEISNMDLSHVDLVVLSACNSAEADILLRGFKLAGVKSLILTLWDIDDKATSEFMTHFYHNYMNGKSKIDAFKAAQQHLRTHPDFSNPEYWGAFVMVDGI